MPYGLSGWEGRGEDGREGVEMELFMGCGEKQIWRLDGGEKQTDMGGLGCHLASSDVQSKLQPRAMSGSMTLQLQQGSVLVSVAMLPLKTIRKPAPGLGSHLRPC